MIGTQMAGKQVTLTLPFSHILARYLSDIPISIKSFRTVSVHALVEEVHLRESSFPETISEQHTHTDTQRESRWEYFIL